MHADTASGIGLRYLDAQDGDGTGAAQTTIIKVEVTHKSGHVSTYNVIIHKPVGGL